MILNKILGVVMIATPLSVWFSLLEKETKISVLKGLTIFSGILCVILGIGLLAGCTTTRTVEVPVPVPCPVPKPTPPPHDYLADLKRNAPPADFVRACLATRESYQGAYEACEISKGQ